MCLRVHSPLGTSWWLHLGISTTSGLTPPSVIHLPCGLSLSDLRCPRPFMTPARSLIIIPSGVSKSLWTSCSAAFLTILCHFPVAGKETQTHPLHWVAAQGLYNKQLSPTPWCCFPGLLPTQSSQDFFLHSSSGVDPSSRARIQGIFFLLGFLLPFSLLPENDF